MTASCAEPAAILPLSRETSGQPDSCTRGTPATSSRCGWLPYTPARSLSPRPAMIPFHHWLTSTSSAALLFLPAATRAQTAAAQSAPISGVRYEVTFDPTTAPSRTLHVAMTFDVTGDRKSTRLNSSHTVISYAVFCLKKKKKKQTNYHHNTKRYVVRRI